MFDQIASVITPKVEEIAKQPLKCYTFKPSPITENSDEHDTVLAHSYDEAYEKRPDLKKWYEHSISKQI
jgi:hypothetical protein